MPYRNLTFLKDTLTHIFNRGNNQMTLFRSKTDYRWLLNKAEKLNLYKEFHVIAYCLIPNHFHFYIKIKSEETTSEFFQRLQLSYSKYFNRKYERKGHVFEGRFKSKFIDIEEYAIYLSKYIHLNPVKAALVKRPEMWEFSNYCDVIERKEHCVYLDFYRNYFYYPKEYADFVNDGLTDYEKDIEKYLFD